MAVELGIAITGLDELKAAIGRIPTELGMMILPEAMGDLLEVMRQAIEERTPVSAGGTHGRPPGAMKRSVKSRIEEQSPAYVRASVGPRDPAAHLVEYGHAIVARGPSRAGLETTPVRGRRGHFAAVGGKRGVLRRALLARRAAGALGRVPPYPFVRPAFDATIERAMAVFNASVAFRLDDVLRKLLPQAKAA